MAAGVTIAAIVEDVVGHDETLPFPSWCWIDPNRPDVLAWQYLSGKAWEIACYVITVILYAAVKVHLIKQVVYMVKVYVHKQVLYMVKVYLHKQVVYMVKVPLFKQVVCNCAYPSIDCIFATSRCHIVT